MFKNPLTTSILNLVLTFVIAIIFTMISGNSYIIMLSTLISPFLIGLIYSHKFGMKLDRKHKLASALSEAGLLLVLFFLGLSVQGITLDSFFPSPSFILIDLVILLLIFVIIYFSFNLGSIIYIKLLSKIWKVSEVEKKNEERGLLSKPIVLTVLILTITIIINLVGNLIGLGESSWAGIFMAPLLAGYFYTNKYKKQIPDTIKTKTSIYTTILGTIIGSFAYWETFFGDKGFAPIAAILIIISSVIGFFITRFGLIQGSNMELKHQAKLQEKRKSD